MALNELAVKQFDHSSLTGSFKRFNDLFTHSELFKESKLLEFAKLLLMFGLTRSLSSKVFLCDNQQEAFQEQNSLTSDNLSAIRQARGSIGPFKEPLRIVSTQKFQTRTGKIVS